jgi:hypothetical protein
MPQLEVDRLSGVQFEGLVLKLLASMGFEVRETKRTGDGGIDVIARSMQPIAGGLFVVQCKRHSTPIGEPVIRDLYGVLHHTGASKGILITNTKFSSQAIKFAEGKPLELIDGPTLQSLLAKHGLATHSSDDVDIALLPPRDLIVAEGMRDLSLHLARDLKHAQLVRAASRASITPQQLLPFVSTSLDMISPALESIDNVLNDIAGSENESLSEAEARDRLAMLSEVTDSLLSHRQSISATRFPEAALEAQNALIDLFDSLLRQFGSFAERVGKLADLHGKPTSEPVDFAFQFSPTIEEETRRLQEGLQKAHRD